MSILVLAVLVVRVLVQQLALCGRELRAGCVQRALGRCGRWPCALLLHLANRVATHTPHAHTPHAHTPHTHALHTHTTPPYAP